MGKMQESEGLGERCFQSSFLNCVINSQNPPILGGGVGRGLGGVLCCVNLMQLEKG